MAVVERRRREVLERDASMSQAEKIDRGCLLGGEPFPRTLCGLGVNQEMADFSERGLMPSDGVLLRAEPFGVVPRLRHWCQEEGALSLFSGLTASLLSAALDEVSDSVLVGALAPLRESQILRSVRNR